MKTTEKKPCKTREIICMCQNKGDNLNINMSEQRR